MENVDLSDKSLISTHCLKNIIYHYILVKSLLHHLRSCAVYVILDDMQRSKEFNPGSGALGSIVTSRQGMTDQD